jgi:hypothetical protein
VAIQEGGDLEVVEADLAEEVVAVVEEVAEADLVEEVAEADLVVEGTEPLIWREKFCTDGFMFVHLSCSWITHDSKSFVLSISFVLFMSMADFAFVRSIFYNGLVI